MKLTSKEWQDKLRGLRYKVDILTAVAWRGNFNYEFFKNKITYTEFLDKLSSSVVDCDKKIFELKF